MASARASHTWQTWWPFMMELHTAGGWNYMIFRVPSNSNQTDSMFSNACLSVSTILQVDGDAQPAGPAPHLLHLHSTLSFLPLPQARFYLSLSSLSTTSPLHISLLMLCAVTRIIFILLSAAALLLTHTVFCCAFLVHNPVFTLTSTTF